MKKISFVIASFLFVTIVSAQTKASLSTSSLSAAQEQALKTPALDKSPMDMSYFPDDYPKLKTQNKAVQPALARVIYSRPQKDNRVIFGELVEYNKVWRLGANEATEIEFFKDASIGGKKVPKGRYTIYAIPTETEWTIILNKDTDIWGAFVYDEKKDLLRTTVPVQNQDISVDAFSMSFTKTDTGANLVIAWEKVSVNLPIEIK
jgi:hypothetical protein